MALMEAAGIEPASRETSTDTSTMCSLAFWDDGLTRHRNFARHRAAWHARRLANSNQFLGRRVSSRTSAQPTLRRNFAATWATPTSSGLPVLRRPVVDFRLQLKSLISFLRGQLINHDTQCPLREIRSNPNRPRNVASLWWHPHNRSNRFGRLLIVPSPGPGLARPLRVPNGSMDDARTEKNKHFCEFGPIIW